MTKKSKFSEPSCRRQRRDVVRGQYEGYRAEEGVAPHSDVETYAALRFYVDSWRWANVPFFIRAGKKLATTATEVLAVFRRPPQRLFDEAVPPHANYLRFRLGPDRVAIALGARVKSAGRDDDRTGNRTRSPAIPRRTRWAHTNACSGDAMRGDATLFARQDAVELAWEIVDGLLASGPQAERYAPGSWGPASAERMLERYGGWYEPGTRGEVPCS